MPPTTPTATRSSRLRLLFEMIRFGIMGATSAGIYLVFFVPLRWFVPTRLWVAATIAYLLSMVANYVLQRNYTFKSNRPHQEAVGRYMVVQLIGLALNATVLEVATARAALPLWLAQGIAIGGVAVWSYVAQKLWVFFGKRSTQASVAGR